MIGLGLGIGIRFGFGSGSQMEFLPGIARTSHGIRVRFEEVVIE
jgi:hypothetical protein